MNTESTEESENLPGGAEPADRRDNGPTASAPALTCSECGASNPAGSAACQFCGEPLTATRVSAGERTTVETATRTKRPSGASRDYLLTSIAILVVALIAYITAAPDPYTGAPSADEPTQAQQSPHGDLPAGHPPMGPTPEQQQHLEELRKRLEARPNDPQTQLDLANALYDVDLFVEAVPLYQQYLTKFPKNDSARSDMAVGMISLQDFDGATRELKSILQRTPNFQPAAFNLFMVYLGKRNRDSAEYWLNRVVEINPTSVQGQKAKEIIEQLRQMPVRSDSAKSM